MRSAVVVEQEASAMIAMPGTTVPLYGLEPLVAESELKTSVTVGVCQVPSGVLQKWSKSWGD